MNGAVKQNGNGPIVVNRGKTVQKYTVIQPKNPNFVPERRIIERATSLFAPLYDDHMQDTGHAPKMEGMLCDLLAVAGDHPIIRIVDIGAGTGNLLGRFPLKLRSRISDVSERRNQGPIELVALDESRDMMRIAINRMRRRLEGTIERAQNSSNKLRIFGKDYVTDSRQVSDDNVQILQHHDGGVSTDLVVVKFLIRDAVDIDRIPEIQNCDIVLSSYIYHWLRGLDLKQEIAKKTFDILREGGHFLSLEEWPLVVGASATELEQCARTQFLQDLADAVIQATTPINIDDLRELFKSIGFDPIMKTLRYKINLGNAHDLYGTALKKPKNNNGFELDVIHNGNNR